VGISIWAITQSETDDESGNAPSTQTNATEQSAQFDRTQDRVIYRGDPPYLTERPILDGNLFVNHAEDYLLLGGPNIHLIQYNAVTRSGNRAIVSIRDGALALLMAEEPYVEFSYQGKFYSLQILSRPYFFTMDFSELSASTTALEHRVELP